MNLLSERPVMLKRKSSRKAPDESWEDYVHATKVRFFVLGVQTGCAATLFFVSTGVMFAASDPSTGVIFEITAWSYPLFRGSFLLSFAALGYGAAMFVWKRHGIAYNEIFGLSDDVKYKAILDNAYSTLIIVFGCFCFYVGALFAPYMTRKCDLFPVLAFASPFAMLAWPFDRAPILFLPHSGSVSMRLGLMSNYVLPALASPFSKPTFGRCFVADVMTSMPKLFADLHYAICIVLRLSTISPCFHAVNAAVLFIPFLIRLFQSLRLTISKKSPQHALNSLKYASALLLAFSSVAKSQEHPFFKGIPWSTIWLVLSIYCTAFNYFWDIVMDWGLFEKDRIFLFSRSAYLWAAISNFIARLGWAVYVSPDQDVVREHVILLAGAAEIARRFQWAIFKVEHEHVQRYRAGPLQLIYSSL